MTERAEPSLFIDRRLIEEPRVANPKIEFVEPMRIEARRDKEDPKTANCNMDNVEEDVIEDLNERELPSVTNDIDDKPPPIRDVFLNDMDEPNEVKSMIETLLAARM
jgi:hypothetical protein